MKQQLQAGMGPMTLSGEVLTLMAIREAQLILAGYIHPEPRDAEKTLTDLLSVLDRGDVVESVERLEAGSGMRLA